MSSSATGYATHHVVAECTLEPFYYLSKVPGKNMRDAFCDAVSDIVRCRSEDLEVIKLFVKQLHEASLIVDDIEDDSEKRRGSSCSHIQYGLPRALNAANYVYFLAMQTLSRLPFRDETMNAFCLEMLNLHKGQGLDIYWRESLCFANVISHKEDGMQAGKSSSSEIPLPSELDYLNITKDKTGGLFRLAVRILTIVSSTPEELTNDLLKLCDVLSQAFQVRDDLMSLCSPALQHTKGVCEDITEGKITLITLHALRCSRDAKELQGILSMKTKEPDMLLRAMRILSESGSLEYAGYRCRDLLDEFKQQLARISKNSKLERLVQILEKDVVECISVAHDRRFETWLGLSPLLARSEDDEESVERKSLN